MNSIIIKVMRVLAKKTNSFWYIQHKAFEEGYIESIDEIEDLKHNIKLYENCIRELRYNNEELKRELYKRKYMESGFYDRD